jgi:hypothetical protein
MASFVVCSTVWKPAELYETPSQALNFMLGLLEAWTLFTLVYCHTCIYNYKFLLAPGTLLESECRLWNPFHIWLSTLVL